MTLCVLQHLVTLGIPAEFDPMQHLINCRMHILSDAVIYRRCTSVVALQNAVNALLRRAVGRLVTTEINERANGPAVVRAHGIQGRVTL